MKSWSVPAGRGPAPGRGRRRRLAWLAFLASATLCLALAGVASAGQANAFTADPGLITDPGGGGGGISTFGLKRVGNSGCLDDPQNSSSTTIHYQVYSCNQTAAQKFHLEAGSAPGLVHLVHGNLCLVPDGNDPLLLVTQRSCGSGAEFDWGWNRPGDGTVYITSPFYYGFGLEMYDNGKVGAAYAFYAWTIV
ncbi:RICIN domain-containing protein [Pseudofrankia saprophytica]|uniref:RICIN domain-containing protein n=1 Tax=Pseudofrankia saprophytica TaxID=298655 RepID=UPI000234C180|nr:RICIN domain-containing protein [Pseudofrankia saprophytica]